MHLVSHLENNCEQYISYFVTDSLYWTIKSHNSYICVNKYWITNKDSDKYSDRFVISKGNSVPNKSRVSPI